MKVIGQRELRNQSAEVMRGLDRGESFIVTRNGVPVGELTPAKKQRYVDRTHAKALFANLPSMDYAELRNDLETVIDEDPTPRA